MTSCTYGFYKNGQYILDYCNSDSYPEGFGRRVVAFIKENTLEELHELWDKLYLVDRKDIPGEEDIKELKDKNLYVREHELETWEDISVTNGGILDYYVNEVYFVPDFSSWKNHQDWTYVINLDKDTFDIYSYEDKFRCSYPLTQIPKNWYQKL